MKKVFQSLSNGQCLVVDIPVPAITEGNILISTNFSLVSSGTERMLVDFGKANFIEKAQQQPEKVKQVLQKVQTDGLATTVQTTKRKLEEPIPLGYSNVGEVVGIGAGVKNFKIGDRVLSNGPHAEVVSVPENLCALIPDNVTYKEAVFGVLGSIALQGIRLANPTFGETFLVSGLGLIGVLTAQLLIANGCNVIGLDPDQEKCKLAESYGIKSLVLDDKKDPIAWCNFFSKGIGIDGAIITASTKSNQPIEIAAKACRKRGRIIMVGVTGMELSRELFYKKELSFQVSCSYGPGDMISLMNKKVMIILLA